MSKRWIPLKPLEARTVEGLCPCCGSLAVMQNINHVVSVQCVDMACGLKVQRWIVNRRTEAVCAKECLRAWQRRDEVIPPMPRFKLPEWAKYVAQDFDGAWHCYDRQPKLDAACWYAASRSLYLNTTLRGNPFWWKTVYRVK